MARGRSRDGANRVYSAQRNGVRTKFAFSFFSLRSIHFANSDVFSPRIGRDSRVGALPSRNSSVTRRLFGTRGSGPEARTVGERHRPWDVEKERCQGRKGGGIAYHLSPCAYPCAHLRGGIGSRVDRSAGKRKKCLDDIARCRTNCSVRGDMNRRGRSEPVGSIEPRGNGTFPK